MILDGKRILLGNKNFQTCFLDAVGRFNWTERQHDGSTCFSFLKK
jgi:hypothetical protein